MRILKISYIKLVASALMALYCLSSIIALFWVVYTSFKTNSEFFSSTWALPAEFRWSNYTYAWANAEIGSYFFNTIYITFLSTLGTLLIAAMAAYVLARVVFPFRQFVFYVFAAAMMVPPMLYLPRGVDNSSGGQTFIESEKWGPVKGQWVHFSSGFSKHFLILAIFLYCLTLMTIELEQIWMDSFY